MLVIKTTNPETGNVLVNQSMILSLAPQRAVVDGGMPPLPRVMRFFRQGQFRYRLTLLAFLLCSTAFLTQSTASVRMLRYVWLRDLTVNASLLLPGSMPMTIGWTFLADGSWFSLTQKTPFLQKGVAFLVLIQLAALDALVGMRGFWLWSTTGTKGHRCCKHFCLGLLLYIPLRC